MSSSDLGVIDYATFNAGTHVVYGKPKVNARGMKSVAINSKHTGRSLHLSAPLMLTWGVNVRSNEDGRESYDFSLQFPNEGYSNHRAESFLSALVALEKKLFADAVSNSKDWFNKSKLSSDQIEVLYNQMLYRPKDPATGEPREGAAPSLRVKLDCWDGEFKQDIYDPAQKKLYPDAESSVTPVDLITKGSQVACILRCGGIYFVNGKFGVTWRLVQAVVKPKASLRGKCHIVLDDEEKMALAAQSDGEEETAKDSDDEDSQQISSPTPPPVEAPPPSSPVKPKRRVVRKARKPAGGA